MAEAQQMMDSGELDYESWDERKVRNQKEAKARKDQRVKSLNDYEKRFDNPNYNQFTGLPGESYRDNLAEEAESLDAKFRVSQEDNFFDDYLNPAVWIGSMAKALGEAPKKAKETDSYMPYVTSIGAPLAMGALAGLGSATNRQFVNNIVNPAAGLRVPYAGAIKKALGTETGLLSKAHNLNPKAISKFDNPEMSYRVAGTDNYDDMLESAVLRSQIPENISSEGLNMARPTSFPSFQKGYADLRYMPEEGGVIFQTDLPTFKRGDLNPVTGQQIKGRHYAHRVIDPETGMIVNNVPAADMTVYGGKPHWWRGHEELYNPYKGIHSVDDINTGNFSDYLLGQKLAGNNGAYNQGIFQLKQFPDRVIKFENPDMIAKRSGLPEYMDFNAAEATKYLPDNQGFAKVYNQLNFDNKKRGLIMPKLQGKSFEDMSRKEFLKWVDNPKTMEDLIQKQKILRDQNLSFDYFGNGNMSVRPDGTVNVFDFEPFSKNRVKGDWWDLNVQGQTNPNLYETAELGKNHKNVLEQKLLKVYDEKMDKIRTDILKKYHRSTPAESDATHITGKFPESYYERKKKLEQQIREHTDDVKQEQMSKILESLDNQKFKIGGNVDQLDMYQTKGEVKTFKRDVRDQDAQSNTGWSSAPVEKKKVQPTTKQKEAQKLFDEKFKVTDKSKYEKTENKIVTEQQKLKDWGKETGRTITDDDLKSVADQQWSFAGVGPQKQPDMMQATPEQSNASRAWEYATNPFTALKYEISGGGYENMPHHINEMRMAGIEPDENNLVGNMLNNSLNLFDAGDKVARNTYRGNYGAAALEAMRFVPGGGLLDDAVRLGLKPGVKYLGKTLGQASDAKNILTDYRNIEELRLANKYKNFKSANAHHPTIFGDKDIFNATKSEAKQLLKNHKKDFNSQFGVGKEDEILLYGAHKDLKNNKIGNKFLAEDDFAKSTGLTNDLTNQEKFLADAYQLEYSPYFNRNVSNGNQKFSEYLADDFTSLVNKNKTNRPVQVSRVSDFNRPIKTLRKGATEPELIHYNDLREGDVIYPEHNWSTTTDLENNVWGSGNPSSKTARINIPENQGVFRPNMYKGTQYANEEELVLPSTLGYKVSGINPQGFTHENPRFIFDAFHLPKEKYGGSTEDLFKFFR